MIVDAATWETFQRYDDKAWSYTDCSILTMTQRLETPQVFAFDAHINQMAGLGVIAVPGLDEYDAMAQVTRPDS